MYLCGRIWFALTVQEVKKMNKYVVVDIETTGNSPKNGDKIIQIGAVVVEQGQITDRFSSFVYYDQELSPFIEKLTGIKTTQLVEAPSFSEVAPVLMNYLDRAFFVAHNAMFDLSFIQSELEDCGYNQFTGPVIDTVELSRLLMPTEESYKLNQLALKLNIDHERPHQADSDAEVTAKLLIFLLNKLETLPILTLQRLKPIIKKLNIGLEEITTSIINNKLKSITNDGNNFDDFRQLTLVKRNDIIIEEGIDIPDFTGEIGDLEQRLSRVMEGFEVRVGQKEMMKTIDEAFRTNHHLLIEAGTGTGKSIAYLFPSIYYAKKHSQPLVISTHTVQLQQQLLERDIHFLKKSVPFSFHYAVLKGRNHYLCLRKFEQQLELLTNGNYDALFSKGQILVWLTETQHGDVEELNLPSGGSIFWKDIQSDASSCIGRHCPWFSRCFYHRARQNAYNAEIIITNHALLFTDLISENQLLPSYKQVVIDEAHQIEDIASDFFGIKADYFSIVHLLTRLGYSYSNELVKKVVLLVEELQIDDLVVEFEQLDVDIVELKFELDQFFSQLHRIVSKKSTQQDVGRISFRYRPNELDSEDWIKAKEVLNRLTMYFNNSFKSIKKIIHEIELHEHDLDFIQSGIVTNFKGIFTTLKEEKTKLNQLFLDYDEQYVYWLEIDAKGAKNSAYIFSKPVDVSELFADKFLSKKQSIIMTSATLTVKDSFDYFINRIGLKDFGPTTKTIPSPYDYHEQVKLMVPSSLPNIKEVPESEYIYELVIGILDIAKVTRGRMLVLFTSYDMLKKAFYQLKDFITEEEFVLIGQGINSGSRAKLTKNFQQFEQAILFGTSSFWEGVDIPGEDLSCIIIVRLPFSPPDNPSFEAKAEKVKENGGNAFMELALPQAIIRFKQGFGRLVRSSQDRGVVFVFDKRITDTRYGSLFVKSLPRVPLYKRPLQELLYELKSWL